MERDQPGGLRQEGLMSMVLERADSRVDDVATIQKGCWILVFVLKVDYLRAGNE